MIYLVMYGMIGIMTLLNVFLDKKNIKILCSVFLLLSILLLLINFPVGPDLPTYSMIFQRNANPFTEGGTFATNRNLGFSLVVYFSNLINLNYAMFRLVVNVICISLCFYTINKYSNNKILSLLLFFGSGVYFVYYGSGIRQMISMSIFFYSYYNFLLNNKNLKYLIGSLFAVMFHEVGIVSFIVFLIVNISDLLYKKIKISLFISVLLTVIGFIFVSNVMPYILNNYGIRGTMWHFLSYFGSVSIDWIGVALRFILIGVDIFLFVLANNKTDIDKKMILTMFLAFCFYLIFSGFSLFARLYDFIAIIELIMIPNLFMKINDKKLKFVFLLGIFMINFVLLFVDVKASVASTFVSVNYNFNNYRFVTIFDSTEILKLIGIN